MNAKVATVAILICLIIGSSAVVEAAIIGITYQSQIESTWCGPASETMILNYYGINTTQTFVASQIYNATTNETYSNKMAEYPRSLGLTSTEFTGSIPILRSCIEEGHPVIVLQNFSISSSAGHYRVVIGYDDSKNLTITHDPILGANYNISYTDFAFMWKAYSNWTLLIQPGNPLPTPTPSPSPTPHPTATPTPTPKPTETPTPTPTQTPTLSPSPSPSPTPILTPTPSPTPTTTPSPTPIAPPTPTPSPTPTAIPTLTPTPTPTPTETPTPAPSPEPTLNPTNTPTETPSSTSTPTPTATPTSKTLPIAIVQVSPTPSPTLTPTAPPTSTAIDTTTPTPTTNTGSMSHLEIYIVIGFLIFIIITVSITIANSTKKQTIEKPNLRIYNLWDDRKEVSNTVKNQFDELLKQQKNKET